MRGRKASEETRKRQGESLRRSWASGLMTGNKGQKMPASMREATSIRMRTNHPMFRKDVSTEEIVRLRLSGMIVKEVAKELGISVCLVERRSKEPGVIFPRPYVHTQDHRNKISKAVKGRKMSPEFCEKISQIVTKQWETRKLNAAA